jgi:pimeloyl-ACP methyl ester carboxylesterase
VLTPTVDRGRPSTRGGPQPRVVRGHPAQRHGGPVPAENTPRTVPSPPSTDLAATCPPGARSVRTFGGRVHHLDFGGPPDAPVALCVHGLGGSALNWGLLGPALTSTHRVLALDLFAHGDSGLPASGHGLAANRDLLHRFIGEVVGQPVVLLGHSMGAVLALSHTATAPASVRRLVVLAPPVPATAGGRDPGLTVKRALLGLPGVAAVVDRRLARLSPGETVRRQLRQATPRPERIPLPAVAASEVQTRRRALRPDAAAGRAEQWAGILDVVDLLSRPRAWRATLAEVDVPTLWLQGADDPLVDAAHAAHLAAARPDWSFEVRADVGHLLALEDPQWTAARIHRWTRELA